MARETVSSTLDTILTRVHARLITVCTGSTHNNTYLSTVSLELPPSSDEVVFEISPSQSLTFDDPHFTGAGRNAMHVSFQINVTIHSTVQSDEVGRDTEYLTHADRGIVKYMTAVLSALADHDLLDLDGNQLLSQPLRPLQAHIPPKDDRSRGYVTLVFGCEFDWYIDPIEL